MVIEVKVPSPGESVSEVEIARWLVSDGDFVEKDQEIAEVESEKATLPLMATADGVISILKETAIPVPVGETVCTIDTSKKARKGASAKKAENTTGIPVVSIADFPEEGQKTPVTVTGSDRNEEIQEPGMKDIKITPVARKMMEDNHLSVNDIIIGLKKITSAEVQQVLKNRQQTIQASREEARTRMSVLRRNLSSRLVQVKNETAMLTTFNEADMSLIMLFRKKHQEAFMEKHKVKLGYMSFFAKAVAEALKLFPAVNSRIEGEDIITPSYSDIGIAVQTDKGLMVPVIRNVENMGISEIEKRIAVLAVKARANQLTIEEMKGGTFTITNGGIFGSMLSTPLLNPPQAAILGMHNIIDRPVAADGQVVIKPMMYLALSYDHRIIDGRDSVSFLAKVKELVEHPGKMLFPNLNPEKTLLDL